MRNDPAGLQSRNAKWRAWMMYCRRYHEELFWEPDNYKTQEQVNWLKKNHPDVSWALLQKFAVLFSLLVAANVVACHLEPYEGIP